MRALDVIGELSSPFKSPAVQLILQQLYNRPTCIRVMATYDKMSLKISGLKFSIDKQLAKVCTKLWCVPFRLTVTQ